MFNGEDQDTVNSWMKELREIRKEIGQTNFQDVADYCVARREETIKLLLEISKFLEDNIDVFYDANWKWTDTDMGQYILMNPNNPVLVSAPQGHRGKDDYLRIWIPGGIKFLLQLATTRVVWVTHENKLQYPYRTKTSPDMEEWKYNFFELWKFGQYPNEGYEQYVKTPVYENYFGKRPDTPQGYLYIKEKVDEDWENANICLTCLKNAIAKILDCDKKLLSEIESVKCDIRNARRDGGF